MSNVTRENNIELPNVSCAVKLASLATHVEEYLSPDGREQDRIAIESLIHDKEIQKYIAYLGSIGLAVVKRK